MIIQCVNTTIVRRLGSIESRRCSPDLHVRSRSRRIPGLSTIHVEMGRHLRPLLKCIPDPSSLLRSHSACFCQHLRNLSSCWCQIHHSIAQYLFRCCPQQGMPVSRHCFQAPFRYNSTSLGVCRRHESRNYSSSTGYHKVHLQCTSCFRLCVSVQKSLQTRIIEETYKVAHGQK